MRSVCVAIEFRQIGTQFISNTAERGEPLRFGSGYPSLNSGAFMITVSPCFEERQIALSLQSILDTRGEH
jgi:hypothetical protein